MEHYLSGVAAHMGPTLAVFFAAFIQSITGFGLVIIAAPLLMFFYEPKLTVPVMLLLACSGNAAQGFLMRRQANFPLIRWMYLGMLVGQPIGFFFFTSKNAGGTPSSPECSRDSPRLQRAWEDSPFSSTSPIRRCPLTYFAPPASSISFSATPPRLSVISSAAFRSRRHSASLSISCPRSSSALSADGRACALFPRLSCANSSS